MGLLAFSGMGRPKKHPTDPVVTKPFIHIKST